jgi:hypothetical protein
MVISAIEDAQLFGQDIYTLYVDFSAAFNMVNHARLLEILGMLGVPQQIQTCVTNLYGNASTRILTPFGPTDPIPITRGTLQGDTLSPLLFLLYLEPLLRWLHVGGRGYRFGSLTSQQNDINHMAAGAYADDLAAMTRSVTDMQIQSNKITAFCQWARLKVNPSKCAITAGLFQIWKYEKSSNWGQDPRVCNKLRGKIQLLGAEVPAISAGTTYTYLGLPLNIQLDWRPALSNLKQNIKNRTSNILFYTSLKKAYRSRMVDETINPLPLPLGDDGIRPHGLPIWRYRLNSGRLVP